MRGWCASLALAAAALPLAAAPPKDPPFEGRFVFRTYGEEEGLSDLSVECVTQDRTGFLWAGTDVGLFRFDGRRFVKYDVEQGIPRTRIYQVYESPAGVLYVGTGSGLVRRTGDRFVAISTQAGLGPYAIGHQGIAADNHGNVYVGTDHGLFVGQADRFRLDPDGGGTAETPVSAVHVGPLGTLYFARGGTLFRRPVGGRAEDFGKPRGLPADETVDEVQTDRAGRLWVRTLKHLYALPPEGARFERRDEGLAESSEVGRLAFDGAGNLLVPTVHGVAYEQDGAWRTIGRREGLAADTALAAVVDAEDSLWVGLLGGGLTQRIGRGEFTNWTPLDGLSHEVLWAIARQESPAGNGALWAGTEQGLNRIDPSGSIRVLTEKDGLGGNTVNALEAGRDGSLWVGSWPGGVTRLAPDGRVRRYDAEDAPPDQFRIAAIRERSDGEVWVGAANGLYRLPAGSTATRLERVAVGKEKPDGVRGFAEDPRGVLWAVSKQGLLRLTGGAPRKFTHLDGLREDFLSSIVFAADGSLVVAYREPIGAEKIVVENDDRLVVHPITTATGLVSNKVVLLGTDAASRLWVGTGSGGDVFARDWSPVRAFGKIDGMISEDLDQNAFLAERDGTVWLGSSRGLIRYRPAATPAPRPAPPVVITGVGTGNRRLDPSQRLVLGPGESDFSASWAGLTFLEPRRVRYRYRMLGLVDHYTETELTEARFPALPTGDYTFEVLCVSATGQVSSRPAAVSLRVLASWWQRWWARAIWALLAAGAVAAVVRLRTRHLEEDRSRLEEAVAARSAELAAANRELREASFTDSLTGARNRRFFSTVIDEDVSRTLRVHATPPQNRPRNCDLIFYIVDIDHFKDINDEYGHDRGDQVLAEVARRLTQVVRDSDRLIRWGGEEFLLISRDADRSRGDVLAERIMAAVGSETFSLGGGHVARRTCSVGWAPFPWFPDSPRALAFTEVLKLADRGMYLAKQAGRNRAVGVLPNGMHVDAVMPEGDWFERPLTQFEGRLLNLVRAAGPDVAPLL
ncbi:MAG TPA: diguanylate cyclase [Thermoanaerobaculia bacterium]|jgi:diguanylate cyclase (GGDEF)-like protein